MKRIGKLRKLAVQIIFIKVDIKIFYMKKQSQCSLPVQKKAPQQHSKNWFPTKQDIIKARERVSKFAHRTQILKYSYLSELTKCKLYFKCQNFQKTGSFKVRGAANKISQIKKSKIICTHSSGNHAQAVAYVGSKLGLQTKIVMPHDTPQVKKNAVKGYGAQIIQSGPTAAEQQAMSKKVSDQFNAQLVHPYNDYQIIAGAASIAAEVYEQIQDLDYIVFPVGGGGLASGTLLSTHYFSPKTQAIGVEPYLARDALLSIRKGQIVPQFPPTTLAEGVRTSIGDKTFQIMKQYISDIILVDQLQMIEAAKLFMERMKIVVEISGALVLAAIIKDSRFRGKKVCAILSGGNIDMSIYFNNLREKAKL